MKVLERRKHFAEDECYRGLFRDPELRDLSQRICGYLPGTEVPR